MQDARTLRSFAPALDDGLRCTPSRRPCAVPKCLTVLSNRVVQWVAPHCSTFDLQLPSLTCLSQWAPRRCVVRGLSCCQLLVANGCLWPGLARRVYGQGAPASQQRFGGGWPGPLSSVPGAGRLSHGRSRGSGWSRCPHGDCTAGPSEAAIPSAGASPTAAATTARR